MKVLKLLKTLFNVKSSRNMCNKNLFQRWETKEICKISFMENKSVETLENAFQCVMKSYLLETCVKQKSFSIFFRLFLLFYRNQKSLKGVETRKKFVKFHSCKNKTLLKLLSSNVLEIGSEFKGGLIFLGSFTVNHGDPWNFFLAITASCYRAKWIPRRVFRFLERVQRGKLGYLRRDTLSRTFRYVFSSPRIFPSFHSFISLLNFQGYIFFF